MWFVKKYLISILIIIFIIGIVGVIIPDKYMDVKGLEDYAKSVKNKVGNNQDRLRNNLNNIKK